MLTAMKSHGIIIYPEQNSIMYCGNSLTAMKHPVPLATLSPVILRSTERKNEQDDALQFTIPSVQAPEQQMDVTEVWRDVKDSVFGDHEIPDRVAKRITIRIPEAPVGNDIFLDGINHIQRLALESTLSNYSRGTCHRCTGTEYH